MTSKDLLLEVGHFLSHTNDYISKTESVHSHIIGGKIIVHHDHKLLKKIDDVTDQLGCNNSEKQRNDNLLTFEQIKLIYYEGKNISPELNFTGFDYYYELEYDQFANQITSPPPQYYTA